MGQLSPAASGSADVTQLDYFLSRLPLVLMFANGFLVYRVLATTRLTDAFVCRSLRRSEGRLHLLFLQIIVTAALLSAFIPNAVTVLILLPVLKAVRDGVGSEVRGRGLTTALTLSAIYGANIGGMGSLIGSPANLLLIGAMDLMEVPGREGVRFLSWFLWSVPLVAILCLIAWGVVVIVGAPGIPLHARTGVVPSAVPFNLSRRDRRGGVAFVLFIGFWTVESILEDQVAGYRVLAPWVCLIYFGGFVVLSTARLGARRPLLFPGDLITGLPVRGLAFAALLLLLIPVFRVIRPGGWVASALDRMIGPETPETAVVLVTLLSVTFLTELLSNTVVSAAFFPLAVSISAVTGIFPLTLLIGVSAASTCAFMTPIATPCNALAFGEMKGTLLRRMLPAGLVLNLVAAVLMALWLPIAIPRVFG